MARSQGPPEIELIVGHANPFGYRIMVFLNNRDGIPIVDFSDRRQRHSLLISPDQLVNSNAQAAVLIGSPTGNSGGPFSVRADFFQGGVPINGPDTSVSGQFAGSVQSVRYVFRFELQ